MTFAFDQLRRWTCRYIDRPLLALPLPVGLHRMMFELQARFLAAKTDVTVRWQDVGGVPTRISVPQRPRGRLLWLHGGGFVLGSPDTHAGLADHLAMASALEVWMPHYRRAPEHPWPAAPDDTRAVAMAMPRPFHLGGDSAGGNLALVILHQLLADGRAPVTLTLISPIVDMRADRNAPSGRDELLLPNAFLRRCRAAYLRDGDGRDRRQSPLLAEYPNCPPTHLELSEHEILEGDGLAIAEHLRTFGAAVTVHSAPKAPHVYHLAAGRSALADAGIARMADHLGQVHP